MEDLHVLQDDLEMKMIEIISSEYRMNVTENSGFDLIIEFF